MHELSLCQSIGRIVSRVAAGRKVVVVEVDVGDLRQVVPETLARCWSLVTDGTALGSSRLAVRTLPAVVRCRACGAEGGLAEAPLIRCGVCGSSAVDILSGEEFLVRALELEDSHGAVPPSR